MANIDEIRAGIGRANQQATESLGALRHARQAIEEAGAAFSQNIYGTAQNDADDARARFGWVDFAHGETVAAARRRADAAAIAALGAVLAGAEWSVETGLLVNGFVVANLIGIVLVSLFITCPFVVREILPVLQVSGEEEEKAGRGRGGSE